MKVMFTIFFILIIAFVYFFWGFLDKWTNGLIDIELEIEQDHLFWSNREENNKEEK